MLKLLLDEHISSHVVDGLKRRDSRIVVHCILSWEEGRFLALDDESLLRESASRGLSLVTYDRRTIPPILKRWAEEGHSHGGVIFVDEKTISPGDIGGLVLALLQLVKRTGEWDWRGRIAFLQR